MSMKKNMHFVLSGGALSSSTVESVQVANQEVDYCHVCKPTLTVWLQNPD